MFVSLPVAVSSAVEIPLNLTINRWGRGKLPSERIKPTYQESVFTTVGIDYAGPVRVKVAQHASPL
jgi:hypothetical protein